jgi:uncharacterized membrane protein
MWIFYMLGATFAISISDIFRKLGSSLRDPFLANFVFQIGALAMAAVLWMFFSRHVEFNDKGMISALAGGLFLSLFTALVFKALEVGPGISMVMPIVRMGSIVLVVMLGVLLLREKMTWTLFTGVSLSILGVYFIFFNA